TSAGMGESEAVPTENGKTAVEVNPFTPEPIKSKEPTSTEPGQQEFWLEGTLAPQLAPGSESELPVTGTITVQPFMVGETYRFKAATPFHETNEPAVWGPNAVEVP